MASHYQHPCSFQDCRSLASMFLFSFSCLFLFFNFRFNSMVGEMLNYFKWNKEISKSGKRKAVNKQVSERKENGSRSGNTWKTLKFAPNSHCHNGRIFPFFQGNKFHSHIVCVYIFIRLINFCTRWFTATMIDHLKSWFVCHLTALLLKMECLITLTVQGRQKKEREKWKMCNACLILGEEVQFLCFIRVNFFYISSVPQEPR